MTGQGMGVDCQQVLDLIASYPNWKQRFTDMIMM